MTSLIRTLCTLALFIALTPLALAQSAQNSPVERQTNVADAKDLPQNPVLDRGGSVADGSFEAGSPNPAWSEGSTNFGTPLCTSTVCGVGGGTGANTGDWWAWFGGITNTVETGTVSQDVTIPLGTADLEFFLEIPAGTADGFLEVSLDGTVVFSVTEADTTTYGTYAPVSVNIDAFADGGTHTLLFNSTTTSTAATDVTNFFVDDVGIAPGSGGGDSPLVISEYVEGSIFNKALEFYNTSDSAVDLGAEGYTVQLFLNGNTAPGAIIPLSGIVAAGDVFVLAADGADPAILAVADQTSGALSFNGDDAVVLYQGSAAVDVIGQVGFDPGSEWGMGDTSTQNNTLRRKMGNCLADLDPFDTFNPVASYFGRTQDTFDDLGSTLLVCYGASFFSGDTTGEPTWHRPFSAGRGADLTCSLSSNADAVPYQAHELMVSSDGLYAIHAEYEDFDGYLLLYENAFDPLSPCNNIIASSDDSDFNSSHIGEVIMSSNSNYIVVITGHSNDEYGAHDGGSFKHKPMYDVYTNRESFDLACNAEGVETFNGARVQAGEYDIIDTDVRNTISHLGSPSSYLDGDEVFPDPNEIIVIIGNVIKPDNTYHSNNYTVIGGADFNGATSRHIGTANTISDVDVIKSGITIITEEVECIGFDLGIIGADTESEVTVSASSLQYLEYYYTTYRHFYEDGEYFIGFVSNLPLYYPYDVRVGVAAKNDTYAYIDNVSTWGDPEVARLDADFTVSDLSPGGSTRVSYEVENFGTTTISGDLFYKVFFDDQEVSSGVIMSGTIPVGTTVHSQYTLLVPFNAPTGEYTYNLAIGSFPHNAVDGEVFTFYVVDPPQKASDLHSSEDWTIVDADPWPSLEPAPASRAEAGGVASYPNPFDRQTEIAFLTEDASDVRLAIYDVLGREVARLVDGPVDAGRHTATFDAEGLAAGVYVWRLTVGDEVQTGRITLVR